MSNDTDEHVVRCNDLTFFELCAARNWAMYVLNSCANVKLVLDVTNMDKTSTWFLAKDIPHNNGSWKGVQNKQTIEYTNRKEDPVTTYYICAFVSQRFPSLYVSLYDITTGCRFSSLCLIIWERNHPEVSNQGNADGRCPPTI